VNRRFFEIVWAIRRRLGGRPDNVARIKEPHLAITSALPTPTPAEGDSEIGYGYLDRWKASRHVVTGPEGDDTSSVFLSHDAPDTPVATRPHVMLRLRDLTVDFSKVGRKSELRHRPGYLREGGGYLDFRPGALRLRGLNGPLDGASFPRDHLRDFVEAIESGSDETPAAQTIEEPTLAFFREPREFRNLFHAHTDWLSGFIARRLFDLQDRRCVGLLMDPHPPTSLDPGFAAVASSSGPVMRAQDFRTRRVRFRDFVVCAPGYASILWSRLEGAAPVAPVGLLQDYGGFLRNAYAGTMESTNKGPMRVTFASRRGHGVLLRRLTNEDAILAALRSLPDVTVDAVDMATLPLAEQIAKSATTDILVGAHGAALAHAITMPPRRGVVEVAAPGTYSLYRNVAAWMGHAFRRIDAPERFGLSGSSLASDPAAIRAAVAEVAAEMRARR
jgi:hypothetical protein